MPNRSSGAEMAEITLVLEPDNGQLTIETSSLGARKLTEFKAFLGQGSVLNCARPIGEKEQNGQIAQSPHRAAEFSLYVYRIYHGSTVDGPGRRSVIQLAGCSICCPGCYVPETHERKNGQEMPLGQIVEEIEAARLEHDGVTILGGEPFDQPSGLAELTNRLKRLDHHLTIYTGYTLESLQARRSIEVDRSLEAADLLIDGEFRRELTDQAGEYRGSRNQRIIDLTPPANLPGDA